MHRLGYTRAMTRCSTLILAALLSGSAYAEVFAPDVFSRAPLHAPSAAPGESDDLYNARLQPETESATPANSTERPGNRWINLPVKAPQNDEPALPKLRF